MKQEELLGKVTENVNLTFDRMDGLRLDGLQDINTFQQVKRNALKKEKERLTDKLGPHHQRVVAVEAKIRDINNMEKDVKVLIAEASITVDPVDENTWKVHGKVMDKDRKGIQGLTAALYDKDGNWQKEVGYGCTNDQGYFSITYSTGENSQQQVSTDTELFLYILDKNHNILYKDQEPLFVHPGHIDYRAIYIADEGEVCTPPEPGQEEPMPSLDEWVVRGQIKDEKGRPIEGATVRLHDNRHLFDDYLGTKVTDESGKFMFKYESKDEGFQGLIEAKPDIYLKAVDKEGKRIYSSKKGVRCKHGGVEVFNIQIKDKTKKK